jgi:deoxyribonucleoside regulator
VNVQRMELLAQIAAWYYEDGESLSVIAKRIGRSVSMVSRMLQEARDRNLVEIRIKYPLSTVSNLERKLEERFAIRSAHVFAEPSATAGVDSLGRFGALGANVISQALEKARIVGVSWGSHVHAIARAVSPGAGPQGTVVQCSGAVGATEPEHDGAGIAQQLATNLGYRARLMHAPLIVDSPEVAEVLRNSHTIFETLEVAKNADVALIGVGTPFDDSSGLRRAGYLTVDDLKALRSHDAKGDILGFHLDSDGNVLDIGLNRRVLGIEPETLANIANVIVAATGTNKTKPLLAALRGGYVNTLLTDKSTAESILQD